MTRVAELNSKSMRLGSYRDYIGLFTAIFLSYLALAAFLPVLPIYARDNLGSGDLMIGLLVTVTAVAAFFTRPIAGNLAERRGYKRVMAIGAAMVAIGSALFLLPLSLPVIVAVRLLQGIGEGAVFTAGAIWVVRLAPTDQRGRLVGLYGISMWTGITLGAFTGGALLEATSFTTVWLFATFMPLFGILACALVAAPVLLASTKMLLILPASVMRPGLSLALAGAGYAGLAAFVVLHLETRGITGGIAALNAFGASYVGMRLFFGGLPDRLGPRRVALWSGLGEAAGLFIVAVAPNFLIAVVGGSVMGVGFSLLYPSLALIAINNTKQEQQGAALGALTSFWDLGLGLFGPALGLVAHYFGYPSVFLAAMVLALTAALVAVGSTSRIPNPPE